MSGFDVQTDHQKAKRQYFLFSDNLIETPWEWLKYQIKTINVSNIAFIITILIISTHIQNELKDQEKTISALEGRQEAVTKIFAESINFTQVVSDQIARFNFAAQQVQIDLLNLQNSIKDFKTFIQEENQTVQNQLNNITFLFEQNQALQNETQKLLLNTSQMVTQIKLDTLQTYSALINQTKDTAARLATPVYVKTNPTTTGWDIPRGAWLSPPVPWTLSIPINGTYLVQAQIRFSVATSGSYWSGGVFNLNTSEMIIISFGMGTQEFTGVSFGDSTTSGTWVGPLLAGTVLQVQFWVQGGTGTVYMNHNIYDGYSTLVAVRVGD
jgi:hypothetical protein